jgi:hypothetical protein
MFYNGLGKALQADIHSTLCGYTFNTNTHPSNLMRFNTTAMRKVYEIFSDAVKIEGLEHSAFLLESYATEAVKAVDEKTTAVAREERERNLLV